ncbi:hypothetical protein CYMTET_52303 [Cymbomonas tetramitiformis]|uniref:Uncharacterized protein n=1 Tax=Cymbomonas tetramitiformis TaxID=36881 RepID=A0AAE0BJB7_9CHLO|nr:hypothetical protein CYMTET_52303 [Cymbomonas tetramitiformis]|eukprot:gene9518-11279_t
METGAFKVIVDNEYHFVDLVTESARGDMCRINHEVYYEIDSSNDHLSVSDNNDRRPDAEVYTRTHVIVSEVFPYATTTCTFILHERCVVCKFTDDDSFSLCNCEVRAISEDAASFDVCLQSENFAHLTVHCSELHLLTTTTRYQRCELRVHRPVHESVPQARGVPDRVLSARYAEGITRVPVTFDAMPESVPAQFVSTCNRCGLCDFCRDVAQLGVCEDIPERLTPYAFDDDEHDGLLSTVDPTHLRCDDWLLSRTRIAVGRDSLALYVDVHDASKTYLCLRMRLLPPHVEEQLNLLYGASGLANASFESMLEAPEFANAHYLSTRRREVLSRACSRFMSMRVADACTHFTFNVLSRNHSTDRESSLANCGIVYHGCHNVREVNFSRLSEEILNAEDVENPAQRLYFQDGEYGTSERALHFSASIKHAHPRRVNGLQEFLQFADKSRDVQELVLQRVLV